MAVVPLQNISLASFYPSFHIDNALFRVPTPTSAVFPADNLSPVVKLKEFDYSNGEEEGSDGDSLHDLIVPLLPPQINYDKVNKYVPKSNETGDVFGTFYFHPSFNNIMLLLGLVAFNLWVLITNVLTIIGLIRTHRQGHMADMYLANLAIGDTLLGILVLPLMSVVILLGYFPFTRFICDLWVYFDYYLIVLSSYGMCAMMCNYLWMLRWPHSFPMDAKHHLLAILCCWLFVHLSWTPSFFNDRLSTFYPKGQCGFSVSRNQYFSFYIGMSGFYIPLALSLICGIWSLAGLKKTSGIPLLSLRQSLSIGRRKRSSRLVNEVIWAFFKIMPDAIIDSLEKDIEAPKPSVIKKTRFKDAPPTTRYYGPNAPPNEQLQPPKKRPPPLKHLKQRSVTSATDPKMIQQMAKDHYPLVVSSLLLFIFCRSLFYVYFGVGSFVPNFFPLDLSNAIYWAMHFNAAISPIVHFAFDPELREDILRLIGFQNTSSRSPVIQPSSPSIKPPIAIISSTMTSNPPIGALRESCNNASKESNVSVSSVSQLSVKSNGSRSSGPPLANGSTSSVNGENRTMSSSDVSQPMANVDVNRKPQVLDIHKASFSSQTDSDGKQL